MIRDGHIVSAARQATLLLCGTGDTSESTVEFQRAATARAFCCKRCVVVKDVADVLASSRGCCVALVLADKPGDVLAWLQPFRISPTSFPIVFGALTSDALFRLQCFHSGARMVSDHAPHVFEALDLVAQQGQGKGVLSCISCGLADLTEEELHTHHPLYHAVDNNHSGTCCLCGRATSNFAVHLHNKHGPVEAREPEHSPWPAFAWVVCRHADGRFLMVNEPAGISRGLPRYWLPAGRVDIGESIVEAARRETLEEGGVRVRIDGILRFMVNFSSDRPTCRFVFLATPVEEAPLKSLPDWESAGAIWVTADEVAALSNDCFRSPDPAELFPAVQSGQLRPLALDTEAFQQFDALLQRLTQGHASRKFAVCWHGLKRTYPASAFQER